MEPGTIVIIVIVVLFYLRLYVIRRGKRRRENLEVIERMKQGKKAKPMPEKDPNQPTFQVKSWWIIAPAILLMLLGLAMYSKSLLVEYQTYWWGPVAVGGLLFIYGFE